MQSFRLRWNSCRQILQVFCNYFVQEVVLSKENFSMASFFRRLLTPLLTRLLRSLCITRLLWGKSFLSLRLRSWIAFKLHINLNSKRVKAEWKSSSGGFSCSFPRYLRPLLLRDFLSLLSGQEVSSYFACKRRICWTTWDGFDLPLPSLEDDIFSKADINQGEHVVFQAK